MKIAAIILFAFSSSFMAYYIVQDAGILNSKIAAIFIRNNKSSSTKKLILKVSQKRMTPVEDEIIINGKLYDITDKKFTNDSVYYYGFEDEIEEKVLISITEHFNTENASTNLQGGANQSFHKLVSHVQDTLFVIELNTINKKISARHLLQQFQVYCPNSYLEAIYPPPKVSLLIS